APSPPLMVTAPVTPPFVTTTGNGLGSRRTTAARPSATRRCRSRPPGPATPVRGVARTASAPAASRSRTTPASRSISASGRLPASASTSASTSVPGYASASAASCLVAAGTYDPQTTSTGPGAGGSSAGPATVAPLSTPAAAGA